MTKINGQLIGQAQLATRAVFNRILEAERTTFTQWVVLNQLDGSAPEDDLVEVVARGLREQPDSARTAVHELLADGRLARHDGGLALTESGAASHARIRGGIDAITSRLYGDLPADDLETAGRILSIVAERADAELVA